MRIFMSSEVSLRLWYYVQATYTEIGGMGYANFDRHGDLTWSRIFLCPQVVSTSEVDFDETGGDAFAVEKAVHDGVLGDPSFVWVSWHSHGKMQTFWSGTDDKRIESLKEAGIMHVVSFVGNHERRYRARYDAFNVAHFGAEIPHIKIDEIPVLVDPDEPIFADCDTEIEKMVTVRKTQTVVRSAAPQATPSQSWRWDRAGQESSFLVEPTAEDSSGVVEMSEDELLAAHGITTVDD